MLPSRTPAASRCATAACTPAASFSPEAGPSCATGFMLAAGSSPVILQCPLLALRQKPFLALPLACAFVADCTDACFSHDATSSSTTHCTFAAGSWLAAGATPAAGCTLATCWCAAAGLAPAASFSAETVSSRATGSTVAAVSSHAAGSRRAGNFPWMQLAANVLLVPRPPLHTKTSVLDASPPQWLKTLMPACLARSRMVFGNSCADSTTHYCLQPSQAHA